MSAGEAVIRRVCVFCGSSLGRDPSFADKAGALGGALARRGWGLVYGGGNVGLMGAVADGALAAGGEVIGVIPRGLQVREVAHGGLTGLEVVESMHARKLRMYELADAFIALPGGFGTLDELFETLTWAQLGMHQKPIGLLSWSGFFADLVRFVDGQLAGGLLRPEHRAMLLVDDDFEALAAQMASYRAPAVEKWLRDQSSA